MKSATSQTWAMVEEVESCVVKVQDREYAPKIRESARVEKEVAGRRPAVVA